MEDQGDKRNAGTRQSQQIAIQAEASVAPGVYSNLMMITHRKEEFVLDFLFVQPQRGPKGEPIASLRSRVITTPEQAFACGNGFTLASRASPSLRFSPAQPGHTRNRAERRAPWRRASTTRATRRVRA
jgi:hypothetical protein